MTTASRCEFVNVSRRYGGVPAVENLSLRIGYGEVLGLVGPNGSGKSTIAKMTGGFLQPTQGEIKVGGVAPRRFRETYGVGFLPEMSEAPERATVRRFLESRCTPTGSRLSPESVAARLNIDGLLNRRTPFLSKGQWRMVLLAYASLGPSPLIILDEPDSGLDPDAMDRLHSLVQELSEMGSTVLILSHNLETVQAVGHRVLVVHAGKVRDEIFPKDLPPGGLRERYREVMGR